MTQAVELVLVQRLRREAARQGDSELAIDLRLACRHLRRYAAQWIALEAERTRDLGAQRRPIAEAADLLRHDCDGIKPPGAPPPEKNIGRVSQRFAHFSQ